MHKTKRILLHTCCGPCATHCVDILQKNMLKNSPDELYDVTLFFSNSNICTREEFNRRLQQARYVAKHFNINIFADDYDHVAWLDYVLSDDPKLKKAIAQEKEGGQRCKNCFRYNLLRSFRFASEKGFDLLSTTLSISPHKSSTLIFEVAREIFRAEYPDNVMSLSFLEHDFKSNKGYQKSIGLSKDLGLYRQNYCGCEFSAGSDACLVLSR